LIFLIQYYSYGVSLHISGHSLFCHLPHRGLSKGIWYSW